MPQSLAIPQLLERCQAEDKRRRQERQFPPIHCLELFRRAIAEQDEAAWEGIYAMYQPLVLRWLHQYQHQDKCSIQLDEDNDYFVNEAVARMWKSCAKKEQRNGFDGLGKYLQYLKLCAGSAIEDDVRKKKKDALRAAVALEDDKLPAPAFETQIEQTLTLRDLKQSLAEIIQNDKEEIVAAESWTYGLYPRQIQARYPDFFTSTSEVSQIKGNLIKRLKKRLDKTKNQ